jgi:pyridoxine 5-phosphate synthase
MSDNIHTIRRWSPIVWMSDMRGGPGMTTRLSVNLNKVALLRNQRDLDIPSVARAAHAVIDAGAHGVTVHPRPDARHIRASDVVELAALTRDRGVEFNVEGYPSADFLDLVRRVRPDQCTLVPDEPWQRTSDHGWDVRRHARGLRPVIGHLVERGIRVSLFVDAGDVPMDEVRALGASRVELYTEPYARAAGRPDEPAVLDRFAQTARRAEEAGLGVNAGHDLNLGNLGALLARIPTLLEVSIGHALIADALFMGLAASVRAYLERLSPVPRDDRRATTPAGGARAA